MVPALEIRRTNRGIPRHLCCDTIVFAATKSDYLPLHRLYPRPWMQQDLSIEPTNLPWVYRRFVAF